ncbi:patatin-like phospholipase family protein [Marinibacterium profundimaris]|uniref:patatin-like phospholipase family protein n=1 Tax=Marinibacterium profundimaris TaxID=1679460 RepID=UPI000B523640|nr:patatin-like phospholipase family protein [Marinibacterium profundimaris]
MSDEKTVLVLQGGGALGAYQCGVAETLGAANTPVDWVAGISIGAINSALIAGNAPEDRIPAMRSFWERITSISKPFDFWTAWHPRRMANNMSAFRTTITGAPGFFQLRIPSASLRAPGTPGAHSFYDTAPLRDTLLELVDFDRINNDGCRLSVGAVNVETGNMTWFDSHETEIRPEHIMASGALPPGFPAVEIDGSLYWDGGLVSNTPLQWVLESQDGQSDLSIFQVDLFPARGDCPQSVWGSEAREKEIRFSSRTRLNTDVLLGLHEMHKTARRLARKLPPEFRDDPDLAKLMCGDRDPRINIAHLIYRRSAAETGSSDYEFSHRSMQLHWEQGKRDAERTLAHSRWQNRHSGSDLIETFDLAEIPQDHPASPERTEHESHGRGRKGVLDASDKPRLPKGPVQIH